MASMHAAPLRLPRVGRLFGRDAIYVDECVQKHQRVTLSGEVNSRLGSEPVDPPQWLGFRCTFEGVVHARITELDPFERLVRLDESLAEVTESELVERLGLAATHRHFVVQSYDRVYEAIATNMDWVWLESRPMDQA